MKRKFQILFYVTALIASIIFIVSCNQPHLPWNKSTWPPRGERLRQRTVVQTPAEAKPQKPIEDFCFDLEETIDGWRQYLEPEFVEQATDPTTQRRIRYLTNLITQYDERCSSE